MTRKFFSLTLYTLSIAIMLFAALATVYSYLLRDLKYYTEFTFQHIEMRTGYSISLDDIHWSLSRGAGLKVSNFQISDPDQNIVLFRCRKIYILPEIVPLLRKRLVVSRFVLEEPEATVIRNPEGQVGFFALPFERFSKVDKTEALFDFSVSLKRLYVNNARILFQDNSHNFSQAFEQVNLYLRSRTADSLYDLSANARLGSPEPAGEIELSVSLEVAPSLKKLESLRGHTALTLRSLPVSLVSPYLSRWLPSTSNKTLMDADINLTLMPGLQYESSGQIMLRKLSFPQFLNGLFRPGSYQFRYSASGSPNIIICNSFNLQGPDSIQASGSFQAADLQLTEPLVIADIKTGFFDIKEPALTYLNGLELPAAFKTLLSRIRSARASLNPIHLRARLTNPIKLDRIDTRGELLLEKTKLFLNASLPELNIENARISKDNATLSAHISAALTPGDRHDIQTEIPLPFSTSGLDFRIRSSFSSDSVNQLLGNISRQTNEWLCFTSGTAEAVSEVSYTSAGEIALSTDLNLGGAGYLLADSIGKPIGVSNKAHFEGSFSVEQPYSEGRLSFVYDDRLVLDGDLQLLPNLKFHGAYQLGNFDLSHLTLPALMPKLGIKGYLNGQGTISASYPESKSLPLRGSLQAIGFSLFDQDNQTSLIQANLECSLDDQQTTIKNSSFKLGKTDFSLSGSLPSLYPLKGKLKADAGLFDIDDFVNITNFIRISLEKLPPEEKSAKKSVFMQTDLTFDLDVQRVNILDWNGKDGCSLFTYKQGVMRWDDITVSAEVGGLIEGAVVYDFSNPGIQILKLIPTRSAVPLTWAIPKLRNKKTVSGTLDLKGEFSSTFRRRAEIIPHMTGQYSVLVRDGRIEKFTVLSKILTLLDIASLLMLKSSDPFTTGLPFDTIQSTFKLENGIMRTDDLLLKSTSLNLSAVGDIDVVNDQLDFLVGVQVFRAIGRVLNKIPIAGDMLTGTDETLTLGYFKVTGPINDSSVRPKPMKAVDDTILRIFNKILRLPMDIIEFPFEVIKKQTQPPETPAPEAPAAPES